MLAVTSFNRRNACTIMAGSTIKGKRKANRHTDEFVIVQGMVQDFWRGELEYHSQEQLQQLIAESYVEYDDIEVTQTSYEKALAGQLGRYMRSENRVGKKGITVIVPEGPFSMDLSEFTEVNFDEDDNVMCFFDVIVYDGQTLEGIIVKKGIPALGVTAKAVRNVTNELPLHLMLRKLKELAVELDLVPVGQKITVMASYYYMKKSSDTSLSGYYDDYFDKAPIRSLSEEFTRLPDGTPYPYTELDINCKEMLNQWATGFEKCDLKEKEDCEGCTWYAQCYYKPIPEKVEEKESVKVRKEHILNDEQQAIVDARKGNYLVNAGAGSGKTETAIKQRTVSMVLEMLDNLVERYEAGEDIDKLLGTEEEIITSV